MALNVEYKESGDYKLVPAGQYQAVCCEVIDLGWDRKTYKNKDTGLPESKNEHSGEFWFQLNKVDDETGKRLELRSRPFNLIFSEKSNLKAFLLQWRGHDLTPDEIKPPGFDIEKLIGQNAYVSIVHAKEGDKTYSNIGSIMPLMPGMPEIQPLNYEPHKDERMAWLAKKRATAAGQNGQQTSPQFSGQQQAPPPVTDAVPGNADIPF